MDEKRPLGPPELNEEPKPVEEQPATATPQLIQSTKPIEPEVLVEEPDEAFEDESDELNEHVEEPGDPDGVHAADEERRWQETHPAPMATPAAVPRHKRRWVVLLVIVLVAAAAVGAYWFGNRKADAPSPKTPPNNTHQQQSTKQPQNVPTKHYDSATYTLGFDYPETWTVSDTTAKLTVTSPAMQLVSASGARENAHVVVTIQNQQSAIAGYPAGGAVAALESDKLTYKQPTSIQRAQTYLSYLSYSQANGLNALYITGDNGYQQGQQVPMSDIVKGNPLISVTFETCTSDDCSTGTPTPVAILATDWKNAAANKDVTALLQSITLN
jgi:hypothetical protein